MHSFFEIGVIKIDTRSMTRCYYLITFGVSDLQNLFSSHQGRLDWQCVEIDFKTFEFDQLVQDISEIFGAVEGDFGHGF